MRLVFPVLDRPTLTFDINQESFVIGRSSQCEVTLVVDGISRQHCRIEYRGGEILITDLASTNGVHIDNQRIPPNVPTPYSVYLPLTIGPIQNVTMELQPLATEPDDKFVMGESVAQQPPEGTATKTRSMEVPKGTLKPHAKYRAKSVTTPGPELPTGKSSKTLWIVAAGLLLGAIYYFTKHRPS